MPANVFKPTIKLLNRIHKKLLENIQGQLLVPYRVRNVEGKSGREGGGGSEVGARVLKPELELEENSWMRK